MRHASWLIVLAIAAIPACSSSPAADEAKGTEVDLDGLKATTPASWKKEDPSNNFRWMQFRIPKVKDDKEDAELAISKGLGGGANPNVERWKASFKPPAGKSADESAKVEEIKIGGQKATYLDVSGTFTALLEGRASARLPNACGLLRRQGQRLYFQARRPRQDRGSGQKGLRRFPKVVQMNDDPSPPSSANGERGERRSRLMHIDQFDYDLPERLIAQEPPAERDESRLLVVPRDGTPPAHHVFRDLPSVLNPGDLLVLEQYAHPSRTADRPSRPFRRQVGRSLSARTGRRVGIADPDARPAHRRRNHPCRSGNSFKRRGGIFASAAVSGR